MNIFCKKPQKQLIKITLLLWFVFFGQIGFSQNLTQTIRGVVFDEDNRDALFGATVFISELERGVSTLEDGSFEFKEIPVGRYSIKVSFVGYKSLVISENLLKSGKELVLEISLEKSNSELEEVVVKALAPNQKNNVIPSVEILSIEETLRLPATFFDPARLAFAYAGVASVNDQANHMVIRGNSPNNMSWRLEGVEIVNPNHLSNAGTSSDRPAQNGGGVNILSAQMLGNSVLMRGSFPSEYGNALAGIMDMNLRKGNNKKHEFTGQIGVIGTDLAAEGPISKKSGSSYLVNYRYSTLGLLGLAGVDLGDEKINYQDVAFHTFFPLKNGGELRLFGIAGNSSNVFETKSDSLITEQKDLKDIEYSSNSLLLGGTYQQKLSSKIYWKNVVVYSKRNDNYEVISPRNLIKPIDFFEKNKTERTSVKSLLQFQANSKSKIIGGVNLMLNNDEFISEKLSSPIFFRPFVEWEFDFSPLKINLGASYSYLNFNKTSSLDPRLNVQYDFKSNQSLFFSLGKNSSLQPTRIYLRDPNSFIDEPINENLELTKSYQISLGYKNQINSKTLLKIEAYYQSLFDVPVSKDTLDSYSVLNLFNDWQLRDLENNGTGKNYGIEISAQQYFFKNWFWLTNLSLYESKFEGSDEEERDTRFNGNYLFKLVVGKEFFYKNKKGKQGAIGINCNVTFAGGMRYSPIDLEASKIAETTIYDGSEAFSLQQKDYFKSDLRIYWKRNKKRFNSTLAIDIQNVTNRKNPSFKYYDTFLDDVIQKNQLGLIPILSYRIEF